MFQVIDGNDKYRVFFKYEVADNLSHTESTTCVVTRGGLEEYDLPEIASGTVTRHVGDKPNKNRARKEAMRRALSDMFPRELRTLFWNAYGERRGSLSDKLPHGTATPKLETFKESEGIPIPVTT